MDLGEIDNRTFAMGTAEKPGFCRKVYKCVYKGKLRAIKKVPFAEGYPAKTVDAELDVLLNVSHPRIVRLILYYPSKVDWNFILEYMENGSLKDLFRKYKDKNWKFSEKDLLGLFMDVAVAVKFLHSKSIIHRDLKPDNILVDYNHRLKIADFGVAKLHSSQMADYQTAIGTLIYMAPEVYMHQPYDRTVDSELNTGPNFIIVTLIS